MPHKDPEARKAYLRQYAQKNPAYARVKAWRDANPEKRLAQQLLYVKKHPDTVKAKARRHRDKHLDAVREKDRLSAAAFRLANKQLIAERKAQYAKQNPAQINAAVARRKAAKIQRTPSWLTDDDLWMIEQAYDIASIRTKMFGFSWHVDHIIPLQGKKVSGLHVPMNLQVIPGAENCSKGNRYG